MSTEGPAHLAGYQSKKEHHLIRNADGWCVYHCQTQFFFLYNMRISMYHGLNAQVYSTKYLFVTYSPIFLMKQEEKNWSLSSIEVQQDPWNVLVPLFLSFLHVAWRPHNKVHPSLQLSSPTVKVTIVLVRYYLQQGLNTFMKIYVSVTGWYWYLDSVWLSFTSKHEKDRCSNIVYRFSWLLLHTSIKVSFCHIIFICEDVRKKGQV